MRNKNVQEWQVAVIGSDAASTNIAFMLALNGHEVNVCGSKELFEKTIARMRTIAETMGSYNGVTAVQTEMILSRVHNCPNIVEAVKGVPFIIESLMETVSCKKSALEEICNVCEANAIVASNTSLFNIFETVEAKDMSRMIMTHFAQPSYLIPTVELACGDETSQETLALTTELMESIGRVCVRCEPIPGLILDRFYQALLREFIYMSSQGWVSRADIDAAVSAHYGPRTTFEAMCVQADYSGLDITDNIAEIMGTELCSDTKLAVETLKSLVDSGKLGMESGEGFFSYDDAAKAEWVRDTSILIMQDKIREVNEHFAAWKADRA